MAHYQRVGDVPPKRHTQHRDPDGNLYYEELMGEEGFSSDSSLLYHRHVPSAIVDARTWDLPDQATEPNAPLIPRHLALHDLFPGDGWKGIDAVTGRRLVLGNADVRISYAVVGTTSPLYRNAVGDEVVFVESGTATVETVFGAPRGRARRLHRHPARDDPPLGGDRASEPVRLYVIEANSHITPPKRYLSRFGQLLEHAPYCERDLRPPTSMFELVETHGGDQDVEVYVKHRGAGRSVAWPGSVHVVPNHPFDVVGWDGCLYPYAFNVADFEPITGRIHQPPPVHQVFEGHNFVVCNFVPRKVDYHPLAVPVPYYHSNVDSDEVMFYVAGDYEARKGSGIGIGSITLHPGGHAHGPQPSAIEASLGAERFDELAVMVDTFRPLEIGEAGRASDDGAYAWSWAGGRR